MSFKTVTNHVPCRTSIWRISSLPELPKFLDAVKDEEEKFALLQDIVDAFQAEMSPSALAQLERGVIHGDFNEHNILLREDDTGEHRVHTAIDFGDANLAPLVFELAIAIMHLMAGCTSMDPNLVGGHIVAGYCAVRRLPEREWVALRVLVAARFAQVLGLGAYSQTQDPGNEYVTRGAERGWEVLRRFWATPKQSLYRGWEEIIQSYEK